MLYATEDVDALCAFETEEPEGSLNFGGSEIFGVDVEEDEL